MTEPIHIISLGAGVQSSTMALMAAHGEITPMPSFAVFADTGDEPREVYDWIEQLRPLLPFRIVWAKAQSFPLSENLVNKQGFSQIPAYSFNDKGNPSIGKRQCTREWKIRPVTRAIRQTTRTHGKRVPPNYFIVWKGISIDESHRMKSSNDPSQAVRYPLIDLGLSRQDCVAYLDKLGFHVPKSACYFCPFRSDAQWKASKEKPFEWQRILAIDQMLNRRGEYLHRSCTPLTEVDFTPDPLDWFGNECEGMCGV